MLTPKFIPSNIPKTKKSPEFIFGVCPILAQLPRATAHFNVLRFRMAAPLGS